MADVPFLCSNNMLLLTQTGVSDPMMNLFIFDVTTASAVLQDNVSLDGQLIAFAYNALDNYIYACKYKPAGSTPQELIDLVRIDGDLNITSMGLPEGLPLTPLYYYASFIDKNGFWYLYLNATSNFYTIDMRPGSATLMKLVDPGNGYQEQTSGYGKALTNQSLITSMPVWVMASDGLLYGINQSYNLSASIMTFNFLSIDPATGIVAQIPGGPFTLTTLDSILTMTIDENDVIYTVTEIGTLYYKFTLSNGTVTGTNLGKIDIGGTIPYGAAMCPLANPGNMIQNAAQWDITDCDGITTTTTSNTTNISIVKIEITKTSNCPWTVPGGVVTYCVTLNNPSEIDLTGTVFRDTLESKLTYVTGSFTVDGAAQTPAVNGQNIEYGLDVNAGQEVTICFKARVSFS